MWFGFAVIERSRDSPTGGWGGWGRQNLFDIGVCVSQLSDEKIYQEVGNIVANFKLYKCEECATAVMQWLRENEIAGRIIKIQTRLGEDYIISKRLERQFIYDSITLNGIHYGVEVKERVFDNLSTEGLTISNWLDDFECPSGEFLVNYLDEI